MPTVQCAKCGLFTLEDSGLGPYPELNAEYRETGRDGRYVQDLGAFLHSPGKPICFVKAHDLPHEMPGNSEQDVIDVGHRKRECDRFIPHQRGLPPLKHVEMDFLQKAQAISDAAQAASLYHSRRSANAAWVAAAAGVASAIVSIVALAVAIIALAKSH